MINFDLPKDNSSIIKVIGVGGGGSNAVNHMFRQGIKGVDFVVCNTDQQALDISPVPLKIALGSGLTEGRGAGSLPEVGRKASLESIEEIKKILGNNTKMVFITAGLGGGTGTGGAPVIAQVAKEMGILTVAIVTVPFAFEGKKRKLQAEEGLKELREHVDTILIINNDKLREMYGNLKLGEAFAHADNILNIAAKSIAEIITVTLHVNLDFADIQTVMKESGVAIMGSASCEGENRALRAVEMALASPLLNDNNIRGARYVLLNITCGSDDITMDELGEITDYLQEAAGQTADIIKGYGIDETLGSKVNVTLVATGFSAGPVTTFAEKKAERIIRRLDDVANTAPIVSAAPPAAPKLMFNLNEEVKPAEVKPVPEVKPTVTETPVAEKTETIEPFIKAAETTQETNIEFEIVSKTLENKPVNMTPPPIPVAYVPPVTAPPVMHEPPQEEKVDMSDPVFSEEQRKKAQERIEKLKQLSYKLKTPGALNDMENEPAYKRRNVDLGDTPHSSESNVSRFTLSEGEDKKGELRQNNSFLHDNVD
ncbi:MAG TPA: cell division protein FtsZ [Bacteroidia bacterium]|nr:cell division protein FtsZ [Bacteroidia bacterium]